MAAVTILNDFGAWEKKICHCFHFFSICHKVMGLDAMILVFWLLSFKSAFSLSSFTLIKGLFSFSLLCALTLITLRVGSSAYLRLLIFLPEILIPACNSAWHFAWWTLHIGYIGKVTIYSPVVLLSQFWISYLPCLVLVVAFWLAYRFLRKHHKVVWYSHLF